MIAQAVFVIVLIVNGWASRYDPGVMQRTIRVRQVVPHRVSMPLPQDLPRYDVYIAVEDCSLVGQERLIRSEGQGEWELALIADCSGDVETSRWMLDNNIIAELDNDAAARWRTCKGIRIEIAEFEVYEFDDWRILN